LISMSSLNCGIAQINEQEAFQTFKKARDAFQDNDFETASKLLIKTKEAIQLKTGIETVLESKEFLRIVVKDYNYMIRNDEY